MTNEFKFYKHSDSVGYDLFKADTTNINELKKICEKNENCVAFNTLGYMKFHVDKIVPLNVYKNKTDGFYVYTKRVEENAKKLVSKQSGKKKLCFYIGYTVMDENAIYGSELALINLCQQLSKYYDVYVFGQVCKLCTIQNVSFFNSSMLDQFMNVNVIDVMIISRYMNYFIEFEFKAKKTYIWLHDTLILPYWNGSSLPNYGKHLINNVIDKVTGVVTLTEWHRNLITDKYDLPKEKVHVIGNALNDSYFNEEINIKKIPRRFIWTSDVVRGLEQLVDYFANIRKEFPDAELYIYRGLSSFDNFKPLLNKINRCSYIHYDGKLSQRDLMNEFLKADIWLYPTSFCETYCMSALEALRAGCYCIATNLAGLQTTIGNHGVLIDGDPKEYEIKQLFLKEVRKALTDDTLRLNIQQKGKEWAKTQNWENVSNQWIELMNKN